MTEQELLAELKKRGIDKVWIGGCGCCDSPWIKVRFDDGRVYENEGRNVGNFDD